MLKKKMLDFHMKRVKDEEDFGRALSRKDVLFYHQVLEAAIDHYLQALYAVNSTFFPSRKRTNQYIDSFKLKPENCYERLLEVIRFGNPDDIEKSHHEWCKLVDDLQGINQYSSAVLAFGWYLKTRVKRESFEEGNDNSERV